MDEKETTNGHGLTRISPMLLLEFKAADGRPVRLCDFASAGVEGNFYRSWLDVTSVADTPFSWSNPLRSGRA